MSSIRPCVQETNFLFVFNPKCRLSRQRQQMVIDRIFEYVIHPERVRDKGKEEYDTR